MRADISPAVPAVTAIAVRRLAGDVIQKLKERAWSNRRSMESEVRLILGDAVAPRPAMANEQRLRMHYAGALKLLEECSPFVDEDVRQSIERCFSDACAHHGYRTRRVLDRIEIEVADG